MNNTINKNDDDDDNENIKKNMIILCDINLSSKNTKTSITSSKR